MATPGNEAVPPVETVDTATVDPIDTATVDTATVDPVDVREALDALGALADPQRRQILVRLTGGAVCTCSDLVEETGVGQPTVSHHLKVLREAGLVRGERCGRFVEYSVVPDRLRALGGVLTGLADSSEMEASPADGGARLDRDVRVAMPT